MSQPQAHNLTIPPAQCRKRPRGWQSWRATAVAALLSASCTNATRDEGVELASESVALVRSCPADATRGPATVRTAQNVEYVRRGDSTLALDVTWPEQPDPAPLVVLLHGGGWTSGSRQAMQEEMLALARLGYAAATVQYRLTDGKRNVFPAALEDVRCAVRFLRARATPFNIAPERVALAGFSAGAHLAALVGTTGVLTDGEQCEMLGPAPPSNPERPVQAVISYAGPQDLRVRGRYTEEQARLVTNFLGVFPGDAPKLAAQASPIVHAGAGDAPALYVHGTVDELVPVDHSRRAAAALRRAGTPATVLELQGVGHSYVGLAASEQPLVRCTTLAFLNRWLRLGQLGASD